MLVTRVLPMISCHYIFLLIRDDYNKDTYKNKFKDKYKDKCKHTYKDRNKDTVGLGKP